MKVEVNGGKCVGSGQCVLISPEVFDQDDDGTVVLLEESPPPQQHDAVREASMVCPATAIKLIDS